MKILVAEDSRTQALRVRADLVAQGFEVIIAYNGRQALEVAAIEAPDAILSDVLMPEIDGFRLCKELKSDPKLRGIPIILRTDAFLDEEDRNFALSLGAAGYIEKEVGGSDLGRILEETAVNGALTDEGHRSLADTHFSGTYERRLLSHLIEKAAQAERISEDLKQAQALLHAVMDNSPALVWVKDLDGRYLMVNQRMSARFGLPSEELIGKTAEHLVPPEEHARVERNFRQVLDEGRPIEFEEKSHHEDGEHTWLATKYPLKDATGKIYAICGISLDITERKILEERLSRAQKMEGIGRLAGGIAHDFNNLLSIIINYATFASEGLEGSDERAADLHEVIEAANRGTELVRQVLTYSRGGDVTLDVLDVNGVIREIEGLLRGALADGVELVTDLDPQIDVATINRDQLGQILLNLVVNARDAMPDGGTVSVTTTDAEFDRIYRTPDCDLTPGRYVRLSVSDTGTGMTPETMERIFDPFFTTKAESGTGLGLSTVHGIVKGVDGCVTAHSALGRGTTFDVYLPSGDRSDVKRAREDLPLALRKGAILVVDDEEGIRATLQRALEQHGYEVVVAASGEEAIVVHELQSEQIALMITDVSMPGMTGVELAERLTGSAPDLRVIFMSGSLGVKTDRFRRESARRPFLPKPFTVAELLTKVQRALGEVPTEDA